jgi:hypothetical protein
MKGSIITDAPSVIHAVLLAITFLTIAVTVWQVAPRIRRRHLNRRP